MRFQISILIILFFTLSAVSTMGYQGERIALIQDNGRLYVEARITSSTGESFNTLFLVDTGSSLTWVDPTSDREGKLTVRENTVNNFTRIDRVNTPFGPFSSTSYALIRRLEIGGRSFVNIQAPCVTLGPERFESSIQGPLRPKQVLGVLGTDLLFSESLYLSISQAEMAWTDASPLQKAFSQPLRREPTGIFVLVPHDQSEPRTILIDTGTYPNLTSQERADQLASQEPRKWRRIAYADGSGLTVGRVSGVPTWGLSGWSFPHDSWGTAYLSRWNLWFERDAGQSLVLHWAPAVPDAIQIFVQSVNLRSWRFNPFWGFNIKNFDDTVVVATSTWGDGTPVVGDVKMGDRLVAFNAKPVSEPDPFTFETGPFDFTWQRPDGSLYLTRLVRQDFY